MRASIPKKSLNTLPWSQVTRLRVTICLAGFQLLRVHIQNSLSYRELSHDAQQAPRDRRYAERFSRDWEQSTLDMWMSSLCVEIKKDLMQTSMMRSRWWVRSQLLCLQWLCKESLGHWEVTSAPSYKNIGSLLAHPFEHRFDLVFGHIVVDKVNEPGVFERSEHRISNTLFVWAICERPKVENCNTAGVSKCNAWHYFSWVPMEEWEWGSLE